MPMYDYKCECGKRFDRFLPLARFDEPQVCACGKTAVKQLSAPAIIKDYAPYECPVTGKMIEGRRAHQENLARTGCRLIEPGEIEEAAKRREAADEAFAESVAESAVEVYHQLPAAKREQLGRELSTGLDISVERR